MRPRVGLTAYRLRASWGRWSDVPACFLPQSYVDSVAAAGGTPVLVPPTPEVADDPGPVLNGLAALVLTGGDDVDPGEYGAERHPETGPPNPERDRAELALLRGALARDLPVLAVCRGLELLNVAYGGDLVQHVADDHDGETHLPEPGRFGRHRVEVLGGRLRELYGDGLAAVPSHHHQAVGRLGEGLVATAVGPDGVLEAVEDPRRSFCVAVQWHPEEDGLAAGAVLFRALVEAART